MAANIDPPVTNPYEDLSIEQVVERFNALPRVNETDAESPNHWHFSFRCGYHVLFIFKIGSPENAYTCCDSDAALSNTSSEGAMNVTTAILKCLLHDSDISGARSWSLSTNNSRIADNVEAAMKKMGVDERLQHVAVSSKDLNKEARQRWEERAEAYYRESHPEWWLY